MQRRIVAPLLAITLLGACSGDNEEAAEVNIRHLRVVKVAGDNQTAPVASEAPPQTTLMPASVASQTYPGGELFPEILVVRLQGPGLNRSSSPTGPVASGLPPNTMVHWVVREEGCGQPIGASTPVDDSAYSVNRWRRGTKAQPCHLDVCRILPDGELACDETFEAIQEPGPLVRFGTKRPDDMDMSVVPGEEIDIRRIIAFAYDKHHNQIDPAVLGALPDSEVKWYWAPGHNAPGDTVRGTGWLAAVPDFKTHGYSYYHYLSTCSNGGYAGEVRPTIQGVLSYDFGVGFYVCDDE